MPGDLDDLLRDLQASRSRLLAVVAGVSEEQFKRRPPAEAVPQAGDWSIAEVLAHLLAAEQRQCERLEALTAGGNTDVQPLNEEERNAEARRGRAVPVPQVIHGLLAARRRLERALTEGLRTELKLRPYIAGAVERAVQDEVIAHEGEHRAQIEAVKASLGAARAASG